MNIFFINTLRKKFQALDAVGNKSRYMQKQLIFILLFLITRLHAQMLTPESFIKLIRQNHPIAKQANIQVEKAQADYKAALGSFDPAFTFDASQKTLAGKNYYYYINPQIKIPTQFAGIDVKSGIERNGGQFLSPQTTSGQSAYLGAELPLVKGLLIDKRRAALQQAKLYIGMSEQERNQQYNELIFDAYNQYWQWSAAYQLFKVYQQFLDISQNRFRLIKIGYQNGERSVADTIEAFTQLQQFVVQQMEAEVKLNTARFELSNYLWDDQSSPVDLIEKAVPDTVEFFLWKNQQLEFLLRQIDTDVPVLKSYAYKLKILEVEKKLKYQSLLPSVNLKANLLNKGYNVLKGFDMAFLQNNYNWGIDVKIPFLMREGKGEYKKAQLKIAETKLEIDLKKRTLENKVRSYYNEIQLIKQQIESLQNLLNGYNSLLRAENIRYQSGESSLFLVNSREMKVIEATEKLISLRQKYLKANLSAEWVAGIIR